MKQLSIAEVFALTKKKRLERRDVEIILCHALKKEHSYILAHAEHMLTRSQTQYMLRALQQLHSYIPVAYIIGVKEFFGHSLNVNQDVLIPRPETELLVEYVLMHVSRHKTLRIGDIGTGSGAIAIALAHALPHALILALDISTKALKIAKKNILKHKLSKQIRIKKSNVLESISSSIKFDVIIANLPYLSRTFKRDSSTRYEPNIALYAKKNGLFLYERLLKEAWQHMHQNTLFALEADPRNIAKLHSMVLHAFPESLPKIHTDLAGRKRFIAFVPKAKI